MRALSLSRVVQVGFPALVGLGLAFLGCYPASEQTEPVFLTTGAQGENAPGEEVTQRSHALTSADSGPVCGIAGDPMYHAGLYDEQRADPVTGKIDYATWAVGHEHLEAMRVSNGMEWQPPYRANPEAPCGGLCGGSNICVGDVCYPSCGASNTCPIGTPRSNGAECYCEGAQPSPGTGSGAGSGYNYPLGKCAWTSIGPTNINGRTNALAMDPTRPNRLFAATIGGIWRSIDSGRRWQRVSDEWWTGKTSAVAVNPALPQEVMGAGGDPPYGSGTGNGVWLSQQNGDPGTWSHVLDIPNSYVNQIEYLKSGNKVYIAHSGGLHIGTKNASDASVSGWSFQQDSTLPASVVWSVVVDEVTSPETVYVTQQGGVVWKKSSGAWARADSGVSGATPGRTVIGMFPRKSTSDKSILYLKLENGNKALLFKTTQGGEAQDGSTAWSPITYPDPSDYQIGYSTSYIAVDPTDANHVIVPGVQLWETLNGGSTWSKILQSHDPAYQILPDGIHVDQHALIWDPLHKGRVIVANDGGVYRQVDANGDWHWEHISHGMTTAEFYYLSLQNDTSTMVTGAFQDNGNAFTFGRRTWNPVGWGDGMYTDVDSVESLRVFTSDQNIILEEWFQPLPYINKPTGFFNQFWDPAGTKRWSIPAGHNIFMPVAPHPTVAWDTLATSGKDDGDFDILHSVDGKKWTSLGFPSGYQIGAAISWPGIVRRAIWISKSLNASGMHNYYVSARARPGAVTPDGGVAAKTGIIVSHDQGATWHAGAGLNLWSVPTVAINPNDANSAIAIARDENLGLCASMFSTSDGGRNWSVLKNGGTTPADAGPTGACTNSVSAPTGAFLNVVFDPTAANTVYAAHQHGVFKGQIFGPNIIWIPFDAGLPNGVDVADIRLNFATQELIIGTVGYGAFRRDLKLGNNCPNAELFVRDNVFDHGQPTPADGVKDPEHPVDNPDTNHPGTYTSGGPVYWWESPDIRVDVPSARAFKNKIETVDSIEFDTCPIESIDCPAGSMQDDNPQRGVPANVYTEITNRSATPIANVRVATFFADATLELPPLPASFWSTTLKKGALDCGTLDPQSGLTLIGCKTLPYVDPDMPAIAKFPWTPPSTAPEHSCAITFVESADTPLPDDIRTKTRLDEIAPLSPLVAQRNLAVINPPTSTPPAGGSGTGSGTGGNPVAIPQPVAGMCAIPDARPRSPGYTGIAYVNVPNYENTPVVRDIVINRTQLYTGKLSFLLPTGVAPTVQNLPPACQKQTVPSGSTSIKITLPSGATEDSVVVGAKGDLVISDNVKVLAADGSVTGSLTNSGTVQTSIGAQAQTGRIVSLATVALRSNSVVHGSVTAPLLTRQAGAKIEGTFNQTPSIPLGGGPSWIVSWPSTSNGDIALEPSRSATKAPGRYNYVSVKTGAELNLSSGTYYFETLQLEPSSQVNVDTTNGPVTIYVRGDSFIRGKIAEPVGGGKRLMFVFLTTHTIPVESALLGSVLAPNGSVILGTLHSGQKHVGAVFAKNVNLNAGVILQHVVFTGWDDIGPCAPLTTQEVAKANGLGLDTTTLYSVNSLEKTIRITLPAKTTIKLGLRYESGEGIYNTGSRFRLLYKDNAGKMLGGVTYVLRH